MMHRSSSEKMGVLGFILRIERQIRDVGWVL